MVLVLVFRLFWFFFFLFPRCHNFLVVAEFYLFIVVICLMLHSDSFLSCSFVSHFQLKSVGQILRSTFTFLFLSSSPASSISCNSVVRGRPSLLPIGTARCVCVILSKYYFYIWIPTHFPHDPGSLLLRFDYK